LNTKFGLSDDNIIEEVAEDVIKEKVGVDVDLTPSTPEVKK
jgi:ribosomal protein L5